MELQLADTDVAASGRFALPDETIDTRQKRTARHYDILLKHSLVTFLHRGAITQVQEAEHGMPPDQEWAARTSYRVATTQ